MSIPPLSPGNGYLPLGRHTATLAEVQAAFVDDAMFATSTERPKLWANLRLYLGRWVAYEQQMAQHLNGANVLMSLWFGGSFVSDRLDPGNLDLMLFADGAALDACKGKPGNGALAKLSSRKAVKPELGIEPIVVRYRPVVSPFVLSRLTDQEREYVGYRGGFDDWWMRARPTGVPKGPPSADTCEWKRGYVEVML
ncbi:MULTISPECIES: DUF6932 family protein [unclassified Nocardioides]|uniref:DUF6932 family protein n=1 Tax=unclassified Nocardioides TaxID=2615069 RepID=UPI0030141FEE